MAASFVAIDSPISLKYGLKASTASTTLPPNDAPISCMRSCDRTLHFFCPEFGHVLRKLGASYLQHPMRNTQSIMVNFAAWSHKMAGSSLCFT